MSVVALFFSIVAAIQDYRTAKIKNGLIMIGMLLAVVLFCVSLQDKTAVLEIVFAILEQMGNIFFLFMILFALYKVRALGAGDCKLLLMIGMYLPIEKSLIILVGSLILAAFYGSIRNVVRILFLKKPRLTGIRFALPVAMVHTVVVIFEKVI